MCKLAFSKCKAHGKRLYSVFYDDGGRDRTHVFVSYAFVFQRCAESVSDGCHDECDDGTCDCFYRADHCVADQLYGAVYTGKSEAVSLGFIFWSG